MIKAVISDLYMVLLSVHKANEPGWACEFSFNESLAVNTGMDAILSGLKCQKCILTNMSSHVTDPFLVNEIENYFESKGIHLYQAGRLGLDKNSSYAYEFIAKNKLGLPVNEVAFIDDQIDNVTAAKNAGLTAMQYNTEIATDKANTEVENWLKSLDIS